MKESKIESYLRNRIKSLGGKCYKWKSINNNGVTDRIVMVYSQVWFVETKSETGELSKIQAIVREDILEHTKKYMLISSKFEVDVFIGIIKSIEEARIK